MRKIQLNGISVEKLGPLENDILEILWRKKKTKVREVYNILKKKKDTDDGIPSPTASPARSVSEKNDFHPKNNLMDRLKSLHLS